MIEPAGRNPYWPRSRAGRAAFIAALAVVCAVAGIAGAFAFFNWQLEQNPCNGCGLLGSAIAVGPANETHGTVPAAWFNASFSIQAAGTGITAHDLKFELLNSSGATRPFSGVALISVTGCAVGYFAADAWRTTVPTTPALDYVAICSSSTGPTTASQIAPGDELVLTSVSDLSGAGDSLLILLSGAGSGTVSLAIP